MTLVRKNRLTKRDFMEVFKKGRTVKNSFFFVRFAGNNLGYGHIAVVVGARVSKKAVVRNRIRRLMTEAVKLNKLEQEPVNAIIVVTRNIVEKPLEEIKRALQQTLTRQIRQTIL